MPRAIKIIAILAGVCLVLALGSGLVLKTMLSGDRIQFLADATSRRMPVPLSVSDGSFDLTDWLLFHPSVRVRDVRIGNPEGFSEEPMIFAREASADVRLLSLLSDRIEVDELRLVEPVLTIEQSSNGQTNIEKLLEVAVPAQMPEAAPAEEHRIVGEGFAIGILAIEKGKFNYRIPGSPGLLIDDVDITVTDFSSDARFNLELNAELFGGDDSKLNFSGNVGPLTKTSFPARGDLKLILAPGEIPTEWRDKHLGDFLHVPGSDSRVHLSASMDGDFLQTFRGDGQMQFDGLQLGGNDDSLLPLSGRIPLQLTVRELLSNPGLEFKATQAALSLGDGAWTGDTVVAYRNRQMHGTAMGSIRGIRIEQLLNAFTGSGKYITGVADIPDFHLRFAGANAKEIRESLQGGGTLRMTEGMMELFDIVATIEQRAKAILSPQTQTGGVTDFLIFAASFGIERQSLTFPDLKMMSRTSDTEGSGSVTFQGNLHFDLRTTVRGELARLLRERVDHSGQPAITVPVLVRGTLGSPKVTPDIKGLAIQKGLGILERLLKKRLDGQQEKEPEQ